MEYESTTKREHLTYAVEGFSAREELLLKSIIRLLDLRTQHAWHYKAYHAHVLVVADEKTAQEDAVRNKLFHKILTLQSLKRPTLLSIDQTLDANETIAGARPVLRLDADAIEAALNDIGTSLVAQHAEKIESNNQDQLMTYKLKCWPIRLTAKNPSRTKIASLLLGKPLSMSDIAQLSGLSVDICESFIFDLKAAESLVVLSHTYVDATDVQAVSISLPAADHNFGVVKTESKAPSIFERIRSRLVTPILSKRW